VSARSLSDALRVEGLPCSVEAWDALAVITLESRDVSLVDEGLRRRVLLLAREHGFSHAAVELAAIDESASVRRD
jgi:hypothetical protein